MTSVYGVMLAGARDQIQNRLEEILDLAAHEERQFAMATMSKLTLDSLGDLQGRDRLDELAGARARDREGVGHGVEDDGAGSSPCSRTSRTRVGRCARCSARARCAAPTPTPRPSRSASRRAASRPTLSTRSTRPTAPHRRAPPPTPQSPRRRTTRTGRTPPTSAGSTRSSGMFVELHATPRLAELFDEFQRVPGGRLVAAPPAAAAHRHSRPREVRVAALRPVTRDRSSARKHFR